MAFAGCIVTPSWEQCTLAIMLKLFEADDSWLRDEDDWCQEDILRRGYERMCLAGAMSNTHMRLKLTRTRTKEYLLRAVREHHAIAANDLAACRTYGHWATCARIATTIRIHSRMALYEQLPPD